MEQQSRSGVGTLRPVVVSLAQKPLTFSLAAFALDEHFTGQLICLQPFGGDPRERGPKA